MMSKMVNCMKRVEVHNIIEGAKGTTLDSDIKEVFSNEMI